MSIPASSSSGTDASRTPSAANDPPGAREISLAGVLTAAILGAVIALPGVVYFDGKFPVENLSVEMTNRIRNNRDDPVAWAKERSNRWTSLYQTTASCLAVFGGCVGFTLGVAHALATKSVSKVLRAAVLGALVGAGTAALGGVFEAALLMKLENSGLTDPTLKTMLGHALAWAVTALGLIFVCTMAAPGRSLKPEAFVRGVLGGLLAGILYSPVAAILFQLERSDLTVPEGAMNKLFFLTTAAVCMGCGLWLPAVRRSQASQASTSAAVVTGMT